MAIRSFAGQGGANTAALLARQNLLDSSKQAELINKGLTGMGQIAPENALQELMATTTPENYAQNQAQISSLAAQSSPEYAAQAQNLLGNMQTGQRLGIQQGGLDERIAQNIATNEMARDRLGLDTEKLGYQREQDILGQKNIEKQRQDDLLMKKREAENRSFDNLMADKRLTLDEKRVALEALRLGQTAPKLSAVDKAIQKKAGEDIVSLIGKTDEQAIEDLESGLTRENLIEDVNLSPATEAKYMNMQKAFIADPTISAEDKAIFSRLTARQKMDALAEINKLKVREANWLQRNLMPSWVAGGSDLEFVDKNL